MNVSERLIEVRKNNGYTRARLAEELGKPYRTITNYETGEREPGHDYIIKIATMFDVTTDYLLGLSDDPHLTSDGKSNFKLTNNETEHIKKYRALDEHGRKMVDIVVTEETARIEKERSTARIPDETDKVIHIQEPIQAASAGFGEFADDETAQWVSVKYNDITKKADYIMRVAGDSMEPRFYDGQRVLVRQQPAVELGEIGIFIKEGMRFIKIYRGDHMESVNPEYKDEPFEEYSRCVGKVLGVLEEDWIVE